MNVADGISEEHAGSCAQQTGHGDADLDLGGLQAGRRRREQGSWGCLEGIQAS